MTSTFDELLAPPADLSGSGLQRPSDRYDRYELPLDDGSGKTKGHTRVTTIAESMDAGYGLGIWKLRRVAWGLGQRPDLATLLRSVPVDDKATIDEVIAKAELVAGMDAEANLGTATHNVLQRFDQGEPIEDLPLYFHPVIRAYAAELARCGLTVIPEMIEQVCRMRAYTVAGKFDNIYRESDGTEVIGDKKTGDDPLKHPHSIATQLAIYANADEIMDYASGRYVPMPPVRRDYALVVLARAEEGTCEIKKIDIRRGLWSVELAMGAREWRKAKGLAHAYVGPGSSVVKVAAPAVPDSSAPHASTYATSLAQPVASLPTNGSGNGVPDPRYVAEVANAVLDDAHRRVGSSEPHGVVLPAPVTYCSDCDHDTHTCKGCGTALRHGWTVCRECQARITAEAMVPAPSPQDYGAPADVPVPAPYVPPAVPSGGIDSEARVAEIMGVRKNDKTRLQGWAKALGCTDLAHHRKWLAEWIVTATPGSSAVEPSGEGDVGPGDVKINSPANYGGESAPTAPVPLAETPEQRAVRQINAAETLPRLTEIWTRWTAEHGPGTWTGNVAAVGERRAAEITAAGRPPGADDCPF